MPRVQRPGLRNALHNGKLWRLEPGKEFVVGTVFWLTALSHRSRFELTAETD